MLTIAYIKSLAKACGFSAVQEKNDAVILQYSENTIINFEILGKLMDKYRRKLLFSASNKPYITFKITGVKREDLLEIIKILLQDIKKLQEGS
ncbi:transcription-repair coupling factor [Acetivibrio straminisolvens JCM 21531]|uniref:Transcription-repair coupling factor n=1 Tax=Acetivibrio straminisolvens JCM 21531 TaxID=1294263 RepID=W4V167_9FIRM|nr:transcription-repair coupling factor [Acetivibrio straminisolvens JCM 21531]